MSKELSLKDLTLLVQNAVSKVQAFFQTYPNQQRKKIIKSFSLSLLDQGLP